MNDKHLWWSVALKNSIVIICWTVLAIVFGHWWIALFSIISLTTASIKTNNDGKGDK